MIEFNQIEKDYNEFVADTDNFIKEQKRKAIKDKVEEYCDNFTESRLDEYEEEQEYERYGDTWVRSGGYYEEEVYDELKERFIEWLENDDDIVVEILEESGVEVNDENKELVIKLAKEV